MSTAPPITHRFSCVPDAYPFTSRNQRPRSDDRALVVMPLGMTDTPHSGSAAGSVPQAIPTAAEAFARLDMPLVEAMMTQRAVRRLLPDPIDDSIVFECIELALRAPTGSNGQNWEFVVVKDRRVKEKLAKQYRQAWSVALATQYRPWTTGSGLRRHLAANDEPMTKLLRAVQWQVDHFAAIPVLVVPCLAAPARRACPTCPRRTCSRRVSPDRSTPVCRTCRSRPERCGWARAWSPCRCGV
jgi:Nitroreductase family